MSPTRGRIVYKGRDITPLPPADVARLGLVRSFQISAVFPHLTVLENVRVALQRKRGHSLDFWRSERVLRELDARARGLIHAVGLEKFENQTAVELPYGFDLGTMAEFDFNEDDDGDGYHPEFVETLTLGHDIAGALAGYVELFSLASSERNSHWQATTDFGLTYAVTEDVQLDCGVNVGVTRAAEDVNPFLGLSVRR